MNRNQSTQTSPELLRKYLASLDYEPPDTSAAESDPTVRTKTLAVIQTLNDFDESRNKIREIFTIRNRSKSGDGVNYMQISEYNTDFGSNEPVVKVHESVVLTKDEERINCRNLVHSTVELTQVTDNTTTVAEYPYDSDIASFPQRYESSTKIKR